MSSIRKAAAALVATGALTVGSFAAFAGPAHADGQEKERDFRVASADVDFQVEFDNGRYEIDVDVDDARPGTKWKVVLRHNGNKVVKGKWRADRDGDVVDIDRARTNTNGKDRFKLTVKQVGKKAKKSRTIVMR